MKIIKQGSVEHHWQFEIVNMCEHCDTHYVLEKGDDYDLSADGDTWVMSPCPACGMGVQTYRKGARNIDDYYSQS